jgi:DNA mismatch repair protein PMS2
MDARVASVLGTKFLAGLTRIELDLQNVVVVNNGDSSGVVVANNERDENDDNSNNNSDSRNNSNGQWHMTGLISHSPTSPNPGNARDMQFFSINGRPVDLPSVSRVIGDVWRTFDPSIELGGGGNSCSGSSRKRPACVLAFSLPASMYDVNLAPDKREVMFTEETSIIGCIREGLMKLWTGQSEGKFRANEVERRSASGGGGGVMSSITKEESNSAGVTQDPITQNDDHLTQSEGNVVCEDITPKPSRKTAAAVLHGDNGSFVTPGPPDSSKANNRRSLLPSSTPSSGETNETSNEESHHSTEENTIPIVQRDRATLQERRSWEQTQLNFRRIEKENLRQEMQRVLGPSSDGESHRCSQQQARRDIEDVDVPSAPSYEESTDSAKPRKSKRPKRQRNHDVSFLDKFAFGSKQQEDAVASENESESGSEEDEMDVPPPIRRNEITSNSRGNLVGRGRTSSGARMLVGRPVSVTETPRTTSLGKRRTQQTANETSKRLHVAVEPPKDTAVQPETVWGNFSGTKNVILQSQRAYLSSRKMSTQLQSSLSKDDIHGNNSNDDEKSTLSLCKEDIRHMSIIGQFNLGFILARDSNNHLWILDQHACDEKYNFERLCKETVIHEQKLIAPLPMELSPSEEHCVLEHMDIFERNGFRFSYDPEKEPLHRLSLTALPHSGSGGDGRKAVQFGKEDVGALCAMLGADGTSSAAGFVAGFGSGADGSGMVGNNAVRRFAGLAGSHNGSSVMRLPKAIAMFASRACRVSNCVILSFLLFGVKLHI